LEHKRKRLLMLHHLPSISRSILRRMLAHDKTLRKIFTLNPQQLSELLSIPFDRALHIYKEIHDDKIHSTNERQLRQIKTITIIDEKYPALLKQIADPPLVLYCQGNMKLFSQIPSISVIGTRSPSREGPQKLHYIVTPLIEQNWTIVSGLAYGIDRLAHELTLRYKGDTIAVLGSGFNHIYPKEHKELYERIATEGLVVTEYPPNQRARKYHFPERNRIISGLTKATLVIEAEERSGTNITVDFALEQGREVYAVPGSILHSKAKGCHRMIQEGAKLVMEAKDILEDYEQFTFLL